ncbi:hypothetical protein [Streptomyces chartreusis]|uniref:hypothetical protein n=1 Tax=Streptomyces chartreusis TaxID=1969 RepID=UPI0016771203|nr:hypothetical protein [Streptomyces chartreusis]GGX56008.1 hypothetical protein GCM10010321_86580 [Streptomyces chartreusis]
MYLVEPDPEHGVVAAPRTEDDRTPLTEQSLIAEGFSWDSEIEAYTRPGDSTPETVDRTARILRGLGHTVITSWTARPKN